MREVLGFIVVIVALYLVVEPAKTAKALGETWHTFITAAYPTTCVNDR